MGRYDWIKQEFSCKKTTFLYESPSDLVQPICGSASYLYMGWRILCAVYFIFVLIYDFSVYPDGARWFIYLGNWAYILLVLSVVLAAIMTSYHTLYFKWAKKTGLKKTKKMPLPLQVYWILTIIQLVAAPLISVGYWINVFGDEFDVSMVTLTIHGVNVFYVVADFVITNQPLHLLHVYIPLLFASIYGVFTYVYYYLGGTDGEGNHFINKHLNYEENPGYALGILIGATLLAMVFYVTVFFLARLRNFVCCAPCLKRDDEEDDDDIDDKIVYSETSKPSALPTSDVQYVVAVQQPPPEVAAQPEVRDETVEGEKRKMTRLSSWLKKSKGARKVESKAGNDNPVYISQATSAPVTVSAAPVVAPVVAPVAANVAAPVATSVAAPVATPFAAPTAAPVFAPAFAPATAPVAAQPMAANPYLSANPSLLPSYPQVAPARPIIPVPVPVPANAGFPEYPISQQALMHRAAANAYSPMGNSSYPYAGYPGY